MLVRTRSLLSISLVALLGLSAAGGALAESTPATTQDSQQAMQLLERAQQAARTLNYHGTFAHQRDGQMRAFRVTHRYHEGQEQERLEVLSSSPREYLRVDDRVQCVIPQQKLIVTERQQHKRFPALLMDDGHQLGAHYEVVAPERQSWVAGRACQPLSILPKDKHRIRYELCIDDQTGLLLEAQTRDADGAVLEHIAFHQVQIGQAIDDEQLRAAWAVQDWSVVDRELTTIDFRALGWFYREPPGYRAVSELEREFRHDRTVQQVILTDGLATISIFIEPYRPDLSHHQMAGAKQSGSVNLFGKRYGAYWVMVAGEAPAPTVENLAQSIVKTGVLHNR